MASFSRRAHHLSWGKTQMVHAAALSAAATVFVLIGHLTFGISAKKETCESFSCTCARIRARIYEARCRIVLCFASLHFPMCELVMFEMMEAGV